MPQRISVVRRLAATCAAVVTLVWSPPSRAAAHTVLVLVESRAETRFQLDLHVADDVLMTYLPAGATGTNRLVYLVAPVTDPSGASAQLVIGGLTEDPADAPGPFGKLLARKHARDAADHDIQR